MARLDVERAAGGGAGTSRLEGVCQARPPSTADQGTSAQRHRAHLKPGHCEVGDLELDLNGPFGSGADAWATRMGMGQPDA